MKRLLLTILWLQFFLIAESQSRFANTDSLKMLLNKPIPDTTKVQVFYALSFTYAFLQVDTSIAYAHKAITLSAQIQYKFGEAGAMFAYGWALWASGNYDKAIEAALTSLNLYKELKNYEKMADSYFQLAVFYRDAGDYGEALKYGMQSKNLFESSMINPKLIDFVPYTTIASIYLSKNQIDSASF